jgi:hypothetical protein
MRQRVELMQYCENLLPYLGFVDDLISPFKGLLEQIDKVHSKIDNVE